MTLNIIHRALCLTLDSRNLVNKTSVEWPIGYQFRNKLDSPTTSFLKNDLKVVDELIGIGSACTPPEGDPCIFNGREVRNVDCVMN